MSIDHADVGDHSSVRVIDRVKDHRARGGVRDAGGRGNLRHDLVQQPLDALAGLARHPQAVIGIAPDQMRELFGVLVGLRGR